MSGGDYLVVGVITGAFGIKGWLKVHSFTDPPDNILCFRQLFADAGGSWQAQQVEDCRAHGNGFVFKLRGCDDRTQAEAWRKRELAIDRHALPTLDDGDYYWYQLEGLKVFLAQAPDRLVGRVDHLLATGANDVLVVQPCEGSIDQRERLLPYRPEVVLQVDLAAGRMLVDWDTAF